jgi:VanZ family protein
MLAWIQNRMVRWKLFYFYLAFLVLLSVLPINSSGSSINHVFVVSIRLDYLLHCLVYIPLVLFLWLEKKSEFLIRSRITIIWVTVLVIFAAATEWIQYYLPYRAFNVNDLISNCLGIILGFIFTFAIKYSLISK